MENKKYFVGVDIGSSNVVMVVGSQVDDQPIKIEGCESQPAEGVAAGSINNVHSVGNAIRAVKERLESNLKIKIDEASVGIANERVRCVTYTDHVFVRDNYTNCIEQEDITSLHERMQNVIADQSEEILARIPQCYIIDNNGKEIDNPVGSFGQTVSAKFLFVLCQKEQLKRVKMAMNHAGMRLQNVFINPMVLPEVLLSDDEKNDGVAIVDIGGETTDVAIYREGKLRHIASIPIGAQSINVDMKTFGITERLTSQYKHHHGQAVSDMVEENLTISIQMAGQVRKNYPLRNLVAIIEARLKDIIEYAMVEVKVAKMTTKIPCGIVITGGSALLENIDLLFKRETNLPARTSRVEYGLSGESCEQYGAYANTAAIGVMLASSKHAPSNVVKMHEIVRPTPPTRPTPPQPAIVTPKANKETTPQPVKDTTTTNLKSEVKVKADNNTDNGTTIKTTTSSKKSGKSKGRGFWGAISNTLDTILGNNNKDEVL